MFQDTQPNVINHREHIPYRTSLGIGAVVDSSLGQQKVLIFTRTRWGIYSSVLIFSCVATLHVILFFLCVFFYVSNFIYQPKWIQTIKLDQTNQRFEMSKSAAQLLYGPVFVLWLHIFVLGELPKKGRKINTIRDGRWSNLWMRPAISKRARSGRSPSQLRAVF